MADKLEFSVKNGLGQTVSGIVYMPEEISEPRPVVIFSHGFASNLKRVERHCIRFAEMGYPSISFDFRGGGYESKSDGRFDEMTIETEIMDLKSIITFAKKLAIADHESIYIMGESLGGLVSLLTAAEKDVDVKGLALWAPALRIPEDAKKRLENGDGRLLPYGCEVSKWFDEVAASIDVEKRIKGLKTPVLMILGDQDVVVSKESLEEACGWCNDAKLEIVEGQGHWFEDDESAIRICDRCIEYFKEKFK